MCTAQVMTLYYFFEIVYSRPSLNDPSVLAKEAWLGRDCWYLFVHQDCTVGSATSGDTHLYRLCGFPDNRIPIKRRLLYFKDSSVLFLSEDLKSWKSHCCIFYKVSLIFPQAFAGFYYVADFFNATEAKRKPKATYYDFEDSVRRYCAMDWKDVSVVFSLSNRGSVELSSIRWHFLRLVCFLLYENSFWFSNEHCCYFATFL